MLSPPCPHDVELKLRYPMCFIFYRIRKIKTKTLIKTKGIVIYHGNNNDGSNDYYEQKIK